MKIYLNVLVLMVLVAGVQAGGQQTPTYTITDLGVLPGTDNSIPIAINSSGQIAAEACSYDFSIRIAAVFKPEASDLGLGNWSWPIAINDAGQVLSTKGQIWSCHVFTPGQGTTEILPGADYGQYCFPADLDPSGRVVARIDPVSGGGGDVGLYSPTVGWSILPDPLGYPYPTPAAINASGQITGSTVTLDSSGNNIAKAFVYTPGQGSIDIGNLPSGGQIYPADINDSGKVVGYSYVNSVIHSWLYTPGESLVDLGVLVGVLGWNARGINNHDQIVGNGYTSDSWLHGFLYSGGVFRDLNNLIPPDSGLVVRTTAGINDGGQIAGVCTPPSATDLSHGHVCLLTPITPYRAIVQPPVNADGTSIFKAARGSIPLKYTLLKDESVTCELPSAMISVTRIAGDTDGSVDKSAHRTPAGKDSNLRIDSSTCQYVYILSASSVGVGTYRADIFINGNVVGSTLFKLH